MRLKSANKSKITNATITTNNNNKSNKNSIPKLIESTGSAIISTDSMKSFTNIKTVWTKMCRLAANLCIDNSSFQVKSLFNTDKYKIYINKLL